MSECFAESSPKRGSAGVRAERGFESTFKNHPNKLQVVFSKRLWIKIYTELLDPREIRSL